MSAFVWITLSLVFGVPFLVRCESLGSKLYHSNYVAFSGWLEARYGIRLDKDKAESRKWFNDLVCYGTVGERNTFEDLDGRKFLALRNIDGSLYVSNDKTAYRVMESSGDFSQIVRLFTTLKDMETVTGLTSKVKTVDGSWVFRFWKMLIVKLK